MFEAEALGLEAMYETGTICVPKPYKVTINCSVLKESGHDSVVNQSWIAENNSLFEFCYTTTL